MKFLALVSGGKDSVYSICKMRDAGHELVGVLYIQGKDSYCDSYMYQTVGSEAVGFIAESLGVPLFVTMSECSAINQDLIYDETTGDEVEDLFRALQSVIKQGVVFEAICSGAILSSYQKNRVENVCSRLSLQSMTPLWQSEQRSLLKEMISYGLEARIVKIASPLLGRKCIGMDISEISDYLDNVKTKYEIHYCGEGGEYETITTNCKYFNKRISLGDGTICEHSDNKGNDGDVFYLKFSNIFLEPK
ncbi:diphthine-ammonia ligase [Enteropsectra breve]|nr:diphthine-ammonia ligase [Enteropsectra breve]